MRVNHYRTTPMVTDDILRVTYFWSASPVDVVNCYSRRTTLRIIRFYAMYGLGSASQMDQQNGKMSRVRYSLRCVRDAR